MIPKVFSLGPLPIHSFGLMVALAFLAAGILLERGLVNRGFPSGCGEKYLATAAISGLVGARIWYIASNWTELRHDLVGALLAPAGFTFFGGFIVAALVIFLMLYRDSELSGLSKRSRVGKFADAVAPALALGYAIGRLGCQLSGDGDYGIATTTSWWGMSYSQGVVPTPAGVRVYPTPLFESALAFVIVAILMSTDLSLSRLRRRETAKNYRIIKNGAQFFLFLTLMGICRFLIEFLRIEPKVALGYTQAQLISVVLIIIGLVSYIFSFVKNSKSGESVY